MSHVIYITSQASLSIILLYSSFSLLSINSRLSTIHTHYGKASCVKVSLPGISFLLFLIFIHKNLISIQNDIREFLSCCFFTITLLSFSYLPSSFISMIHLKWRKSWDINSRLWNFHHSFIHHFNILRLP